MEFTCATIEAAKEGTVVVLASYTQVTADVTSTTTAAARLVAEINAGTNIHGFTATNSTAIVTITAPKTEGIFLNSGTPYVATTVGTLAGTLTQNVVAGTASYIDIAWYHINEYFRIQPKGELYVGMYEQESSYVFADITTMQNFAVGAIKQIGIYQKMLHLL